MAIKVLIKVGSFILKNCQKIIKLCHHFEDYSVFFFVYHKYVFYLLDAYSSSTVTL